MFAANDLHEGETLTDIKAHIHILVGDFSFPAKYLVAASGELFEKMICKSICAKPTICKKRRDKLSRVHFGLRTNSH
jgi:hypothetical protein